MAIDRQVVTPEQFEVFVNHPNNVDKLFELIAGEIVEVPSNPYVSQLSLLIGSMILAFVRLHKLGHVTGEAGGYWVSGERYAPDVGFVSYAKQKELAKHGYNPNPPDLAVEVISSNSSAELNQLRIKITNYLAVGTVVWVVKPDEKQVEVHRLGHPVVVYHESDTLSGGDVLPNFEMRLTDLFE